MEQKPAFDGRTILVMLVCLGVWWGWQQHLQQKYPDLISAQTAATPGPSQEPSKNEGATSPAQNPLSIPAFDAIAKPQSDSKWTYENDLWKVVVSSAGGRVSEVKLKKFTDNNNEAITVVAPDRPGSLLLSVEGAGSPSNLPNLDYKINAISSEKVELLAETPDLKIKKTLTVHPDKYVVSAHVEVSGKTSGISRVHFDISDSAPHQADLSNKAFKFLLPSAGGELREYYVSYGSKHTRDVVTPTDAPEKTYEQANFAALGSRYFTALIFNRSNVVPVAREFRVKDSSILRMSYPVLDKNAPLIYDVDFYAGPKAIKELEALDKTAGEVVDFGMFSVIAVPLLNVMKFFYTIFHNYGLAIIALTILVRLLTFPFTYMSYKSMKAMQTIQPEIARLKEIHKDNTQALNQEMMKLMRDNKVNPMGGCIPMLLQLPVFWALYQVLQNSIELYHSPFFGWIHDLSQKDPFYVLPILMGLSMFMQQKMTPSTMDPAQAKVMMIMPIFFSFLMVGLPSGLTLYIFVSTLFGILQQVFMMKDRGASNRVVVRRA